MVVIRSPCSHFFLTLFNRICYLNSRQFIYFDHWSKLSYVIMIKYLLICKWCKFKEFLSFFFLCPYMILLCQSRNIEELYYHTKNTPWYIQMKSRETLEDKTIFFGILPRKLEKYTFWYNSHQSILVYSLKKGDLLKVNVLL